MALTVATNTGALMAQAAASSVNKEMELSMERLSTGKRINSASDDAAGIAIASRLTSEIRGTNQAIRNAMDAQSLIDTAEGAHDEVENILQRMRELAVQATNDTNDSNDRSNLQIEMDQLTVEIDRIAASSTWAGQALLNGATPSATALATSHTDYAQFTFQVGSGTAATDTIQANIGAVSADALGVGGVTSLPSVSEDTDSTAGTVAYTSTGGVLTFAGTYANGDTITISIDGTDYTATLSTTDQFDISTAAGVAASVAKVIEDADIAGVSLTDNEDGTLTFNAGATAAAPTVTSSISSSGNQMTMAATGGTSATGTLTFANDFVAGDKFKVEIQGQTISITTADSDNFSNNASGIAAQMADAINDQVIAGTLSGVEVSVAAAVVSVASTLPTYADFAVAGADISGTDITINSITTDSTAGTLSPSTPSELTAQTGTITAAGTWAAGETFSISLGDAASVAVTGTFDTSTFASNVTGVAAGIAAAINQNTTATGLGYSATSAAGVVTLTKSSIGAVTANATANTLTFTGTFNKGDVISGDLNGQTISITVADADGFDSTAIGVARQFAAAVESQATLYDDFTATGVSIGAVTGTGSAQTVAITFGLENFDFDSTAVTNATAATGTTLTMSGTTLTVGGAYDSGATGTLVVAGETVTFDLSDASYAADLTGAAANIAAAIIAADIDGVSVTDNEDGTITITGDGGLSLSSNTSAQLSIEYIDLAIETLNAQRAELGAITNRLDSTVSNLTNISSNLQAGRGRIEDADFAAETTSLAKSQILQQASTAMLAQANASKQNVLSLLQG
ncbi:flagellin [Paracoccaceae bacterium]|nr:flagellin [Paracoccaceae bacterium]